MEHDAKAAAPEPTLCMIDRGPSTRLVEAVKSSLDDALQYKGKLPPAVLDIEGMSGKK